MKVVSESANKLKIIGDNILYNNGIIKAYYILPTINYSTSTYEGVINAVQYLVDLLSSVSNTHPNAMFTIEKVEKVIMASDVRENILETIQLYRPDYNIPPEFSEVIDDDLQEYCLLLVDILPSTFSDAEDYTLKDASKAVFNNIVDKLTGISSFGINEPLLLKIEESIYNAIRHKCVRASKELVFYSYVSKLYPNYDISYKRRGFISDSNFTNILGSLNQIVIDKFGYFELVNDGVEFFDLSPVKGYGCMLTVLNFPDHIPTGNFPIGHGLGNCTVTMKCIPTAISKLKLKRARSKDKYEFEKGQEVGASEEELDESQEGYTFSSEALSGLSKGDILCSFSCNILVTDTDLTELKKRVKTIIESFRHREVIVSKSLSQATDFMDFYVNMHPHKLRHTAPLSFPACFQMNSGSLVGDVNGAIFSPAIGEDME